MTPPRKPSLILPFAVVAMLLLAGYVGANLCRRWYVSAYYETVRTVQARRWDPTLIVETYECDWWPFHPHWLKVFFAPIHEVDRKLRPHVWEPKQRLRPYQEGPTRP